MKVMKLRRKTVLALKRIFERKQERKDLKSPNISLTREITIESNIYVDLEELKKTEFEEIKFKRDISECARCIFGDPSLTCTCSFRQTAPDFKLYEDEEAFYEYP